MNVRRWIFLSFLFIAPLMVAFSQVAVLEFPTVNFFTGAPYTPYPMVFYLPIRIGVALFTIGILITFTLSYIWQNHSLGKYTGAAWVCLSLLFLIIFWLGINMSQRSVIFDYLLAINANGLHFIRMFSLPIRPEVFPKGGYVPFYTAIATSGLGIIGIIIYCYTLYSTSTNEKA